MKMIFAVSIDNIPCRGGGWGCRRRRWCRPATIIRSQRKHERVELPGGGGAANWRRRTNSGTCYVYGRLYDIGGGGDGWELVAVATCHMCRTRPVVRNGQEHSFTMYEGVEYGMKIKV